MAAAALHMITTLAKALWRGDVENIALLYENCRHLIANLGCSSVSDRCNGSALHH